MTLHPVRRDPAHEGECVRVSLSTSRFSRLSPTHQKKITGGSNGADPGTGHTAASHGLVDLKNAFREAPPVAGEFCCFRVDREHRHDHEQAEHAQRKDPASDTAARSAGALMREDVAHGLGIGSGFSSE